MASLIDIVGSFIITGSLLLIVIYFTINMNNSSNDIVMATINMNNSASSTDIIKKDFARIGFRVNSNQILIAESTRMKFLTDYDNNGIIDTIEYKTGNTQAASTTQNPNDFPLYRVFNSTQNLIALVTNFSLSYYDSLGAQLSYSSLSSQTIRNKIKTITINLNMESISRIDTTYQFVNWKTNVRPKNL